jgi:hypothetical protein
VSYSPPDETVAVAPPLAENETPDHSLQLVTLPLAAKDVLHCVALFVSDDNSVSRLSVGGALGPLY